MIVCCQVEPTFTESSSNLSFQLNALVGNVSELDRLIREEQSVSAFQLAINVLISLKQIGKESLSISQTNEVIRWYAIRWVAALHAFLWTVLSNSILNPKLHKPKKDGDEGMYFMHKCMQLSIKHVCFTLGTQALLPLEHQTTASA